jgi:hypothetical protein
MNTGSMTFAALAALAAAGAAFAAAARPSDAPRAAAAAEAGHALGALVNARLREGGSFFSPKERAGIEEMCGYRPGEWDGFEANDVDGVFHCTNGRTVDSPEMRAILRAAAPRIEARVHQVMASAEVKAAIARIASDATARALAEVGRERHVDSPSER